MAVGGHTPYAQWTVYRRRNLFIVAARTDEPATILARALVEAFAAELPESHARFTRASDAVRVASLLRTGQLDLAVIARQDATAMLDGAAAYAGVGPVPLRLLADLGEHLLVTVADFKDRHAYLLAQVLEQMDGRPVAAASAATEDLPIQYHPGALAYREGKALPADDADEAEAHDHPHPH